MTDAPQSSRSRPVRQFGRPSPKVALPGTLEGPRFEVHCHALGNTSSLVRLAFRRTKQHRVDMRIRAVLTCLSLLWASAFATNATGQELGDSSQTPPATLAIDPAPPPNPEQSVPPADRVSFLQRYVRSDAPRHERNRAFRRLLRLLPQGREQRDWASRYRAFVLEEGAEIEMEFDAADHAPVRLCAPPVPELANINLIALRRACSPDFEADSAYADDVELLALALQIRGDLAGYVAMRERALLLRNWRIPDQARWHSLAREAARAGLMDAAHAYCRVTQQEPIYRVNPMVAAADDSDVERCLADIAASP